MTDGRTDGQRRGAIANTALAQRGVDKNFNG